MVSGKGGAGKTTVAAALAIALARRGRRILLAEVEGRQGLAQVLDVPPLSHEERHVATAPGGGEVLGIGNDRQMPVYYAYAKKNQYGWPILPNENVLLAQALENLGTIQMPGIIVFDKNGTIEASTIRQRGTPLQTADGVVAEIDNLLAAKME